MSDAGSTLTVATAGCRTFTVARPSFPSTVAVTVVVPASMASTSPITLTCAIVGLALVHVGADESSRSPNALYASAFNVWCASMSSSIVSGWTTTVATEVIAVSASGVHPPATNAEPRARMPSARETLIGPPVRRSFGGSTGMAGVIWRAEASELCVPGFRRVCLCRDPIEGAILPSEVSCSMTPLRMR